MLYTLLLMALHILILNELVVFRAMHTLMTKLKTILTSSECTTYSNPLVELELQRGNTGAQVMNDVRICLLR